MNNLKVSGDLEERQGVEVPDKAAVFRKSQW